MISKKASDSLPGGRQDVQVNLRGADIAPVKARHIDSLVLLERQLMKAGHMIEFDPQKEELIIDNMEGTLLAKMYGLNIRELTGAYAAWNHWNELRKGQKNEEKPDFAKLTFLEIWWRSLKAGLLDLRERHEETSEDDGTGYEDELAGRALVD